MEPDAEVDIVNKFFRSHYPSNIDRDNFSLQNCGRGYGLSYNDKTVSNIFPEIICADGLRLSVQGHFGAYCAPRDDFAENYFEVEILGPKRADPLLAPYERECNSVGEEMIYPYVPIDVACAVILSHGGIE